MQGAGGGRGNGGGGRGRGRWDGDGEGWWHCGGEALGWDEMVEVGGR